MYREALFLEGRACLFEVGLGLVLTGFKNLMSRSVCYCLLNVCTFTSLFEGRVGGVK